MEKRRHELSLEGWVRVSQRKEGHILRKRENITTVKGNGPAQRLERPPTVQC